MPRGRPWDYLVGKRRGGIPKCGKNISRGGGHLHGVFLAGPGRGEDKKVTYSLILN